MATGQYAVTREGALHAEDVLARRVRLLIESGGGGAPEAALTTKPRDRGRQVRGEAV